LVGSVVGCWVLRGDIRNEDGNENVIYQIQKKKMPDKSYKET